MYTILIVDDEPLERDALAALLHELGADRFTILTAGGGRDALEHAEAHAVDLALLDIRLPGMSGLDLAAHLRDRFPALDIVFLSAFDSFSYARTALRLRAEDYLIKPVEDSAVARVVERCYARGRLPASVGRDRPGPTDTVERFQEAARFLEYELLDDVIAGDVDYTLLSRGFELIGVERLVGHVVIVAPRLDEYSFRLETDAQRRTVVLRVLRFMAVPLRRRNIRVLMRAHAFVGYLVLVHGGTLDTAAVNDELAPSVAQVANVVGVSVRYAVSETIDGVGALVPETLAARRRLSTDPGDDRSSEEDGAITTLERRAVSALISDDRQGVGRVAKEIWARLREDAECHGGDTLMHMRLHAWQIVTYLVHALRVRGVSVQMPPDFGLNRAASGGARPDGGVADGSIGELRVRFLRAVDALVSGTPAVADPQAVEVRRWIASHLSEDIGLPDVARLLRVSVSTASRTCSRLLGMGFREFLRSLRLERSRDLLSTTTLPVRVVAERVGFRDGNYLTRVFTRTYGVSPNQFRRTIGGDRAVASAHESPGNDINVQSGVVAHGGR